jgi:hypothetical protein
MEYIGAISFGLGFWNGLISIENGFKFLNTISFDEIYSYPENINIFDDNKYEKKIFKIKLQITNHKIFKNTCIMKIIRQINTYKFKNSNKDHSNKLFLELIKDQDDIQDNIHNLFETIENEGKNSRFECINDISIPNTDLYLLLECKDNIEHSNNNIILKREIFINDIDYELDNIKYTKSNKEYKEFNHSIYTSVTFLLISILFFSK